MITREWLSAILFVLTLLALFAIPADSKKQLFNYDVPIHGCLEQVTLLQCDPISHPLYCRGSRIRFVSEDCLMLEAK